MKIAEVKSRFAEETGGVGAFISAVTSYGFNLKWKEGDADGDKNYFVYMDFKKTEKAKKKKMSDLSLKPCLYKKR